MRASVGRDAFTAGAVAQPISDAALVQSHSRREMVLTLWFSGFCGFSKFSGCWFYMVPHGSTRFGT